MSSKNPIRRIDLGLPRAEASPRFAGWRTLYAMQTSSDSTVYRAAPADSAQAEADYVLKTLSREASQRPDRRAAFQREALAAGAVQNPHLIPVLDGDLRGDRPFLVFPFLEGSTLRQAVSHRMPLSLPSALWTIRQAAEALMALHNAGYVHLDVKPENLHLSPRGHVTLLDLGSAQRVGERLHDLSGDVAYSAPEIWSTPYVASGTADVYSLGLTLFEALVGAPPCDATNAEEWIAFHKRGDSSDLREFLPNLPIELAQLVESMLRKSPARRPSLSEAREELVRLEVATFRDRRSLLRPFDPDRPTGGDGSSARKSRPLAERSASTNSVSKVG
ncbi:MAG TPA: serine/threonine-protein kinase [Pirellulaceae bacterium]|jgi:serine/threonine-protein kinase|nr:serine/threonine-protein kinase [Pirellulaceae bacterium]